MICVSEEKEFLIFIALGGKFQRILLCTSHAVYSRDLPEYMIMIWT